MLVKDVYGIEMYEYNKNNDVIKMKDIEGNVMDIVYDGLDVVFEIDQSGKLLLVVVYDKYGNQI